MLEVRTIRTFDEFRASIELRTSVYRSLGYLHPSCLMDVDAFDWSSLHFVALDRQSIVGTVRLILPVQNNSVWHTMVAQSTEWVARLRESAGLATLNAVDLPVSETLETNKLPADLVPHSSAELSRIMVNAEHRGLGISRMLIAAVVDQAKAMSIEMLLLQCRPSHINLFRENDFELWMEGLSYNLLCVTGDVVIMRMHLDANFRQVDQGT